MISNIQNVKKAREMRLSGLSLSEIHRDLNIPISTLSAWLKDITLNSEQLSALKNRVIVKMGKGRMNALISLKSARIYKEKTIFEEAEREFPNLSKDIYFMSNLSLYWAKGSIKNDYIQFTSSNRVMIDTIVNWLKIYLKLEESLIKVNKNDGYFRIMVNRVDAARKVKAWQKLLIKYYGDISSFKMHP